MVPFDWRELYAANQAEIRRALGKSGKHHTPAEAEIRPALGASGKLRSPAEAVLRPDLAARTTTDAGGGAAARAGRVTGLRHAASRPLIHIPGGLDPGTPAPLVCLLHGCTQDPASFAAATAMNEAADRHGFVVVYPGQDRNGNAQGCWNWFLPEHQRRGAGEPAAIAAIAGELVEGNAPCTVDARRVYVAGLSAGGAMAAILAACYPDLFAAVAVHSGLPYQSATDVASAFRVMARASGDAEAHGRAAYAAMGQYSRPVPSIIIQGSADSTVAPANALEVLRQSMTANHLAAPDRCSHDTARPTESRRGREPGGHAYTRSRWYDSRGALMHELLHVDGLGHAWSGGVAGGSFTDPRGPSATEAIWTFFDLIATRADVGGGT